MKPTCITLVGAESTGKTTLATALAAHYGTVWVPEYLRTFVGVHGRLPVKADLPQLVWGHLDAVAALKPQAEEVLFLDTDLYMTCLYSRYYFDACPSWVEAHAQAYQADAYLLLDTDIPWAPDPGQREGPAVREAIQALLVEDLECRGLPYTLISGSPAIRLQSAIRVVDTVLQYPPAASGTNQLRAARS